MCVDRHEAGALGSLNACRALIAAWQETAAIGRNRTHKDHHSPSAELHKVRADAKRPTGQRKPEQTVKDHMIKCMNIVI